MSTTDPRPSVDSRTRPVGASVPVDPARFWAGEWRDALGRNGARAAEDAARLDLAPLAITVDGDTWTLRRGDGTLDVAPGNDAPSQVALTGDAFTDLVQDRRTAL